MSEHRGSAARWAGARWLGVGLAAAMAVVTIALAVTDRLSLYISPDQTWFAVAMAVLALIGTASSFALPLGAEADHGHDHGDGHGAGLGHDHGEPGHGHRAGAHSADAHAHGAHARRAGSGHRPDAAPGPPTPAAALRRRARGSAAPPARRRSAPAEPPAPRLASPTAAPGRASPRRVSPRAVVAMTATVAGGVIASGVVVAGLVLPPASLSAELAMDRDTGTPPLFAGADDVTLAATANTAEFGVGDWSAVFATSTDPDAFSGERVQLTGFVTPAEGDPNTLRLGRLVITHCVIDAQPASIPVQSPGWGNDLKSGDWIEVTGTVTAGGSGALVVQPDEITAVPEPDDPYEY